MNDSKINYQSALDHFQIGGQSASQLMDFLKQRLKGLTAPDEEKFGLLVHVDNSQSITNHESDKLEMKVQDFLQLFESTKKTVEFTCTSDQADNLAANCALRAKIILALCRNSVEDNSTNQHVEKFLKIIQKNLPNQQKKAISSQQILSLYRSFVEIKAQENKDGTQLYDYIMNIIQGKLPDTSALT